VTVPSAGKWETVGAVGSPRPSVRSEAGALLAAAAVCLGARVGEHFHWAAATFPALLLVVGPPLAILVLPRLLPPRRATGPGLGRRVAGIACLAACGAVSMARAGAGLERPSARLAAAGDEGNAVVRLAADPQGRWAGVRAPARLEVVNGRPARGTVLVVTNRAAAERLRLLEAGESAVLLGRFRPLEAGEQRWRWRHVGAVFEAHDLIGAGRAEPAVLWAANALRHRVLAGGEALDDTDRALVGGFLVGDDRDLPPRVAADFRAAGLSHLLVVSGANVTLALAVLAPLLRNFGLLGRLLGGVAGLVVFCAMTRFEPSVLRAGAMSGLALVAAYVGRPAPGLRVLALTVAGLILVDPFLMHSLGFGLSCGASAGILLLAGPFARRIPLPRFLREPLAVTAAAQVGVAPVALPAFGQLPLTALPANLLAAPAAAALSVWGLGSGLVGGLVDMTADSPGVGPTGLLQAPTAALAGWIRFVARLAAQFPITIGPRPAFLGAAVAVLWWRRSSGRTASCSELGLQGPGIRAGIRLEAEEVVEGQQAGAGQQERGGGHGVEEVDLEAAPAGLAEDADGPFHLGHDQQELHRGERSPEPGQQPQCQADATGELDDDRGPGQQLR
jgi:ComEC/Rec2-related protein